REEAAGAAGGGGDEGGGQGWDEDVTRGGGNTGGGAELKGFQRLGFKLAFNGNLIQDGITLYREGRVTGKGVEAYGLEEEVKYPLFEKGKEVPGKFLLKYQTNALQQIFGDQSISGYSSLWEPGGVIERAARDPRLRDGARGAAILHFKESLSRRRRQGGGDEKHDFMANGIDKVICAMEAIQLAPSTGGGGRLNAAEKKKAKKNQTQAAGVLKPA
ncbi:hypothetical protein T484DRAFT_1769844, partial [Baffinella frigidus]